VPAVPDRDTGAGSEVSHNPRGQYSMLPPDYPRPVAKKQGLQVLRLRFGCTAEAVNVKWLK